MKKLMYISLQKLLRLFRDIDNMISWIVNIPFKHNYQITGQCKKRGICCQNIAIKFSISLWKFYNLRRIYRFWYEYVYNFNYIRTDNETHSLIFSCNYLRKNKCSIYWKRPLICRRYPKVSLFNEPSFLKGCGYSLKRTR